jgi:ketosteroid isomerase-like protein
MTDVTPHAIQTLLDKDAIKEVLYRFDYLCDEGDPVRAAARYCTDDVKFDGGVLGTADGRDAFQELGRETFSEFPFTRHLLHNPVIEVSGDDAWSKWYAIIPSITDAGEAVWWQVTYEIEFRRVDGEWKISAYNPDLTFVSPYETGWAKQPFIEGIPGTPEWRS